MKSKQRKIFCSTNHNPQFQVKLKDYCCSSVKITDNVSLTFVWVCKIIFFLFISHTFIISTYCFTVDLKPLLTPEAVTELVMLSISELPRHMPKMFRSSYTPIAAAGTDAQVNF